MGELRGQPDLKIFRRQRRRARHLRRRNRRHARGADSLQSKEIPDPNTARPHDSEPCILGQSIGRWGNFVNQEAFGALVFNPKLQFFPFAVYIQALGEWHQATFFYESAWNFLLFLFVLLLARKRPKDGTLLAVYLHRLRGCAARSIEGLRTDSLYLFGGVRVSQVLSAALVLLAGNRPADSAENRQDSRQSRIPANTSPDIPVNPKRKA